MPGEERKQRLIQDFVGLLQEAGSTAEDPDTARIGAGDYAESYLDRSVDGYTHYDELILDDGMVMRRYENGAIRLENPASGVIQEERIDGKLLVSLPTGKVVFQAFPGEPLLVYDTVGQQGPFLAGVSLANLPGECHPRHVYHFQDGDGGHMVEVRSLRYYRLAPPRPREPEEPKRLLRPDPRAARQLPLETRAG
ncbi:MAG: hypothetical protein AB1758_18370 [Candidatus Eremiobacterota bacterium]